MKTRLGLWFATLGLAAIAAAGCDALLTILLPSTVRVTLVNESPNFDVEGKLFFHDDENVLELILVEIGEERDFTIQPGRSVTQIESCARLQAIIIEDADLRVLSGIGPETSTGVFRMGEHFECGNEIVFTFSHSGIILDFDVTTSIR